jgi:hypothetical protein
MVRIAAIIHVHDISDPAGIADVISAIRRIGRGGHASVLTLKNKAAAELP